MIQAPSIRKTFIVFCSLCMSTLLIENAYANENNTEEEYLFSQDQDAAQIAENEKLTAAESIEDVVQIAKDHHARVAQKSDTPREQLHISRAKDAVDNAILNRHYVEQPDADMLEEKKLFNQDLARANGQNVIKNRNKKGKTSNNNSDLENGLSSSFSKGKSHVTITKNKDSSAQDDESSIVQIYRDKVLERKQKANNKKGDGNSSQYRNQAGSFSDAFKKDK